MAGPTSSGRVTRADVARLAGVSTAVVSYVLNGGPGPVSAASRQRVLRAVDALGYRPNANARALATGLSGLLGLVVPDISNPLFAEFALSIELCAQAKGYGLLLANSEDSVDVEQQQVASLVARGADGILLASVAPSVTLPRRGKTRVVLLNALRPSSDSTSVGPDALDGARLATEHLISHGHSSVGLIVGPAAPVVVEAREVGWLDAHTARRMVPGPVARDDFSRGGGYRAAMTMFASRDAPSAVFVSSDLQAIGALAALNQLGLRVPEDIAVVSFDGTSESEYSIPPLTTVRQPLAEMAARLIELVIARDSGAGHDSFPVELVIRRSCGCE